MTTEAVFACTLTEFKRRCKELIDAAPGLDEAGRDNGVKMLNLSYLSVTGSELDIYQASIALKLTLRQVGAI